MPLDPSADIARRAWLPCPECDQGADCSGCLAGRTCRSHWQYLLGNKGPRVFLQCPNCTHLWDTDPRTHPARSPRR